jgi:hypothetical protein
VEGRGNRGGEGKYLNFGVFAYKGPRWLIANEG